MSDRKANQNAALDRAVLIKENATLKQRVAELENGYREAIEDIQDWSEYASDYFRNKHDIDGTLAEHRRILEQENE